MYGRLRFLKLSDATMFRGFPEMINHVNVVLAIYSSSMVVYMGWDAGDVLMFRFGSIRKSGRRWYDQAEFISTWLKLNNTTQ
jgi:hypothetical protein